MFSSKLTEIKMYVRNISKGKDIPVASHGGP
jgi:hypothetical protein